MANVVRGLRILLPFWLFVAAGCSSAIPVASPGWTRWADRMGGVTPSGCDSLRASAALARLNPPTLKPSVFVLCNESLGAWTFADGNIFVSEGLIRILSDDELAAVLAHEIGHLRSANRLTSGAAFDGITASIEIEAWADDQGRLLLKLRHIPEASLPAALLKVRNARATPIWMRAALDYRIHRLTTDAN
jgi:hypothetical protein